MLGMLGKISVEDILKYFPYFSLKTTCDISCKLTKETNCKKCHSLFSEKKKKRKNIINLSSAEFAQSGNDKIILPQHYLGLCYHNKFEDIHKNIWKSTGSSSSTSCT